jgi:hypothetical protein
MPRRTEPNLPDTIQRRRCRPQEPDRHQILRYGIGPRQVLQARQAVVAAQAAVVLEQVQRQRQGHRLRQD